MIPPTSIDGTDITGATIDGTDVKEITVDGDTVFTAGPDIPDSPLSRWQFEQTVEDSEGDNDGTDNTSAGYVTDSKEGNFAKDFDGVNDYIDVGRFSLSDATFAGWIYPKSVGNTIIARFDTGVPFDGWSVRVNPDTLQFNDGSNNFNSNTSLSTDQWYHFAIVNDADGDIRFYLDGQLDGVHNGDGSDLPEVDTDTTIGREKIFGSGNDQWDGYQDDLIIWPRPLSGSEVSDLFNSY